MKEVLFHLVPVDNMPKGLNVIGATVLIFKVISMFPNIEGEQGNETDRKG